MSAAAHNGAAMVQLPTGTVTFLFTDIEGSTRLLGQLGERFQEILEIHQRLMREAVSAAGGVEVGTEGDSFFVAFTAAPQAVAAAVEAQRALESHPWPEDGRVRVRMGLHTGEGRLGGDDYVGVDVHRAARIAAAGHGGQVLLSEATRALVAPTLPEGVKLRALGEHRLKDLPHPEQLFQLVIPGLPSGFPPIKSMDARRGNLPRQLTSFVGRQKELREIKEILGDARLLTLVGPGGAGKTRLSLQVGMEMEDSFDDGVFFVPLATITDPDLVAPTIADTLGIPEDPGRPPIEKLIEYLRDKELVIVLDNFEQVTPAAPAVGEILGATERVTFLATSREPLALVGEHEYAIPPLRIPDPAHLPSLEALSQYEAVKLFVERAVAVKPGFAVTNENAPAVAEICARLDGLPLAIELAAARVKLLSPEALLKRLAQSLSVLRGAARNVPERQQTLLGAIAWSYDLLDEQERALLARLAIFVGGFTLDAAETICNPDGELGIDTLDGVASLVNKSLIRQMVIGDVEDRFLMLQTIRDFAEERFAEQPDRDESEARHTAYYLDLAEELAPLLMGKEQAHWLDRLAEEHDNLRAVLGRSVLIGDAHTAGRLGLALWRFWQMRGHLREARERLDTILGMPSLAEHPQACAGALEAAGGVAYWMGDMEAALAHYGECLDLRRGERDPRKVAEAAYNLACIYVYAVDDLRSPEKAEPLLDEAVGLFRDVGDEAGLAKVLWARGGNVFGGWDFESIAREGTERALADFDESLALYRRAEDRFGEAWALHMKGLCEVHLERLDEARAHFGEALSIFLAAGDRSAIPIILFDYALLAAAEEDGGRALRLAGASATLEREFGVGIATSAAGQAGVYDRLWRLLPKEEGERLYREGEGMSAEEAISYALEGLRDALATRD